MVPTLRASGQSTPSVEEPKLSEPLTPPEPPPEVPTKRVPRTDPSDLARWMPASASKEEWDAAEEELKDQKKLLARAMARLAVRNSQRGIPSNLQGADAEEWSDRKVIELLPLAMAEVEYQLLNGTNSERWQAAKQVLESTGRGKKEALAGGVSPIMFITGVTALPWETGKPPKVVSGSVTRATQPVSEADAPNTPP